MCCEIPVLAAQQHSSQAAEGGTCRGCTAVDGADWEQR